MPIAIHASESERDAMPDLERESPDDAAGRSEMRALLERKLDGLPEVFRTVFLLRSVGALSVEETAECLDLPAAPVRNRQARARSLLRASLAREIDLAERNVFAFGGCDCERIVATVLPRLAAAPRG